MSVAPAEPPAPRVAGTRPSSPPPTSSTSSSSISTTMSMPIDGIEYTAKGDRVRLVKRATPNALLVELTDNNADASFVDEFLPVYRACGASAIAVLNAMRSALLSNPFLSGEPLSSAAFDRVDSLLRWASWYTQELVDEPGAVAVLESLLAQLSARFSRAHDFQTSLRSLIDSLAPLRRAAEQALLDMRHIPLDRARAACGACLATPSVVLAQQLTVIESRLYAKVRVTELLPWARERGAATRQAPNLAAAVLRLERVAQWVSSCVLWQTELDKRTAAVAHFLEVATECLGLNNYTSIVQIMTGLQMNCVFRLRRTWKGLSDAHRAKFRALRNLMSSDDNYAAYRSFLATQKPPCVPNLSLYLSDLKRADKSARDAAAAEAVGVVPFAAFRTVSRIVTKIMQWQQYPYALDADPTLVEHMTYVVGMTNAELTLLSTSLEPDVPADGAGGMSPRLGASSSSAAAAAAAANAQLPPHMRQSVTGSPTGSPQPGLPRSNSTSHGRQPIVIEMPPDDAVRPSSPPPPPAEPSASALAAALAADADTSYPFDEDDSRNNIVLSGGSVHAATLSKLVERLTYDQPVTETVFDIAAFERVFFHQYRMLMTPEALLTLLERRFDVPQPPSVTSPADVQKFRLGKQLPIQMKVYNVCHYWAMHFYDEDIGPDAKLEQRFLRFAQRLAQVRGVQDRLTLLLREKRQNYDQRAPIDRAVTSLAGAEPPATAKLLDFTADELARQLSVDHCVLYRTVRLRTVPIGEAKPLASGWPEAALRDPLLGPAAGAWQQLRQWTTTCVARDNDARVRADVIVRLVDVAQRLLEYHNYFAFTAVVHGLASPLVSRSRLPHTWKAVPSRKLDTFVQFAELASTADGFGRVREHMSHARAPTVPHLPTLLYDMAAADAANVADPPAPMVEFRRLQARANALLPLERFKAPLTSYEWYSDGVRSEAAAAEHWGRAAQHVRAYLGTLDTLDNARLAQLVSRHGESGDTVDAPHAEDEGGAGAGEADENGVIDVPVSPRRGGDPSMSPRGRSKRRGATTSAQAQSGPSATELLSVAVRAGYLSKKKRTQLMGRWQKRYFVLSGESLYFFSDPAAERPQNEFKLLTTVVKPSKERLQFELWPAGGGEAYAIMANDDVELIAWMQAISDVCDHAMMRSLYSGGQPVKTVREQNNAPEWRRLLHEVADLPQNRKCVDCSDLIDKATAWASINLGVFICIECSGVHRSLGVTISQVRSVALDEWQLSQIAVMREIGNQNANDLWEHSMTPAQKLKPKAPRNAKEAFLRAKYVEKKWYDRSRLNAADEDDDVSAPPPAPDEGATPVPPPSDAVAPVRAAIVTTAAAGGSPLMAARAAPAAPVLQSRPSVPISTASPQAQTYRTPASAPQTAVAAASRRESLRNELLELLRSDPQFRTEVERMLSADLRAQIDEFRRQQEQGLQELRDRLAALDEQQ